MGNEFQDRLAKIQERQETGQTRSILENQTFSGGIERAPREKVDTNRMVNLIRITLLALVGIVSLRVFAIIGGYDLNERLNTLQAGSIQHKVASIALGAFTVADPFLVPLLGGTQTQVAGSSGGFKKIAPSPKADAPNLPTDFEMNRDIDLEPIPVKQGLVSKVLTSMQVDFEFDPTKFLPPAPEGWFRLTEADLRFEATAYYAQKAAWGASEERENWAGLPFLKGFLSIKGDVGARDNQKDFAWYVNESTGQATFLAIKTIVMTGPVIDMSGIAAKLRQFSNETYVMINDVEYEYTLLKAEKTLDYHFRGRDTKRYKANPHPTISVALYSTASDQDILELLQQIDVSAVVEDSEATDKLFNDRAKAVGAIANDGTKASAAITQDAPGGELVGKDTDKEPGVNTNLGNDLF